jgi:GNAT superfamily N-acetyltransferase
MTAPAFVLRLARPEERNAVVAIDDAAALLYRVAGLAVDLPGEHPFVVAEIARWERAILEGRLHVAATALDTPVGFASLASVNGYPYLDQLSVLPGWMRRGIGTALVRQAIERAGEAPLWLTTYDHLPWNRPFYERFGFVRVPEERCGAELHRILAEQRESLPAPEMRCAMVRLPCSG